MGATRRQFLVGGAAAAGTACASACMRREAMPTVPARNAILSGRRMFPFREWEDHPGLLATPGWAPLDDVTNTFTSVLRQAGWWTGYVTDNPFLGFAGPYEPLRQSFDLFTRHGGQIGGADRPLPPRP